MSRILFADDDAAMREMVIDVLENAGHQVRGVADGDAALAEVRADPPDIIVLDYRMGRPDGLEVCRQIKGDARLEHLPVLILTAEVHVDDRILGFAAGANDYLAKPFDARELLARVNAMLRLSEQGRELNPTTGLPGGGSIEREIERRRGVGAAFSLCYLDLDYFKPMNDCFGFAVANSLIESLGNLLRVAVSRTDNFAAHIGGDDFLIMCDPGSATHLVDRIQREFAEAVARVVPAEVVERGSYHGKLRNNEEGEVPLTRVAAAILNIDAATMPSVERLGELAADVKRRAKEPSSGGIAIMDVAAAN